MTPPEELRGRGLERRVRGLGQDGHRVHRHVPLRHGGARQAEQGNDYRARLKGGP